MNITQWIEDYQQALQQTFGNRIWFVGLQGSYGRGEATETSDIDMVVILDALSAEDIGTYNAMLDTLPHREKICGFLSGQEELMNWEPSDLFQFYYDTTPIQGSLDALLPRIDDGAISRAICTGVCNVYHGCVHNMLYEKSDEILKELYKSASFVVQAIYFKETGAYMKHQKILLDLVAPEERLIIENFLRIKRGERVEFQHASERLLCWCQKWINKRFY